MICLICLENPSIPCVTECGHIFCYEHIKSALQNKPECPVCRNMTDINKLIKIYQCVEDTEDDSIKSDKIMDIYHLLGTKINDLINHNTEKESELGKLKVKHHDLQNKYNSLLNKISELREELSLKNGNTTHSNQYKPNKDYSVNYKWKFNTIENSIPVHSVDISSKNNILISGNWNGDLMVYDLKNNRIINDKVIKHTSGPIYMTRFSPIQNELFGICGKGNELSIYNSSNYSSKTTISNHNNDINTLTFSPINNNRILTGSDDKCWIIQDIETGKEILRNSSHEQTIYGSSFHPSLPLHSTASFDKTVKIFDSNNGENIKVLNDHSDDVISCEFSNNGYNLSTSSDDGTIYVYDIRMWSYIISLNHPNINSFKRIRYSINGDLLLSCTSNGIIVVWDTVRNKCIYEDNISDYNGSCVIFDGCWNDCDNSFVACSHNGNVYNYCNIKE